MTAQPSDRPLAPLNLPLDEQQSMTWHDGSGHFPTARGMARKEARGPYWATRCMPTSSEGSDTGNAPT